MRTFLQGKKQRLYGAIDLGIELVTLGGYGLEEVDNGTSAEVIDISTAASRRSASRNDRPAPFDANSLAL